MHTARKEHKKMPAPLDEGERIARVLRDKRFRRALLDREIAALEELLRVYDDEEQAEARSQGLLLAAQGAPNGG
jgi:hypothetical protein